MRDKIRIAPSCFPTNKLDKKSDLAKSIKSFTDAMAEGIQDPDFEESDRAWIDAHLKYSAETMLIHFGLLSPKRQAALEAEAKVEADRTVETDSSAFRDAL